MRRDSHCIQLALLRLSPGSFSWPLLPCGHRVIDVMRGLLLLLLLLLLVLLLRFLVLLLLLLVLVLVLLLVVLLHRLGGND